jgi:putative flippase GtrA
VVDFKGTAAYLFRYGFTSLGAVLCDIGLYSLLVHWSWLAPFGANVASSSLSVVGVWTLSGKYLFSRQLIMKRGYGLWFLYQFAAILAYSSVIKLLYGLGAHYVACKILVTALSFIINSTFFKLVILGRYSRSKRPGRNEEAG